jgi:O-methyltransferase involved in polyketide biosynthesis
MPAKCAIGQHDVDTVLNLGCGLDARPYRLDLPRSLHWIDLDSPTVLAYKARKLAPHAPVCALDFVAADLSNADDFDHVLDATAARAARVLVITEGVLVYQTPARVRSLAAQLRQRPELLVWICDVVSPQGVRLMEIGAAASPASAGVPLQFVTPDARKFFRRCGWETAELRSCFDEGTRLQRFEPVRKQLAGLPDEHVQALSNLSVVVKLV